MCFKFRQLLDNIDSSGGHLVLLFILLLTGLAAYALHFSKAEDIVLGAFGALLLALKGSRNPE